MCRLYGFRSSIDSSVHHSLVAAENALALQSQRHGDGWGMAYYVARFPHLIRAERQAITDSLFRDLSAVVSTRTFLAHIRKATVGGIGVLNCHPFQHGCWTFAHNGEINGFAKSETIRNRVGALVDERFRRYRLGATDSEVCFYLFLSHLSRTVEDIQNPGVNAQHVVSALRRAVSDIREAADKDGGKPSLLTFLLTNGELMMGYSLGKELYFSTYKTRCPERDTCYAFEENRCEHEVSDGIVKHLIVASEKVETGHNVWKKLHDDEYVMVAHGMNLSRGLLLGAQTAVVF